MRTRDYTRSNDEVSALERIIREDQRVKVVQRATTIRLLQLGQTSTD